MDLLLLGLQQMLYSISCTQKNNSDDYFFDYLCELYKKNLITKEMFFDILKDKFKYMQSLYYQNQPIIKKIRGENVKRKMEKPRI